MFELTLGELEERAERIYYYRIVPREGESSEHGPFLLREMEAWVEGQFFVATERQRCEFRKDGEKKWEEEFTK